MDNPVLDETMTDKTALGETVVDEPSIGETCMKIMFLFRKCETAPEELVFQVRTILSLY